MDDSQIDDRGAQTMRGLNEVKNTLPSTWYYDPAQYARELEAIWYQDWVCVGREESLRDTGSYFLATVGNQSIIVTRDAAGQLRAFHNTCRHRGSLLCREDRGRFRNGRIVCPYHTWTYSTEGALLATPGRIDSAGFEPDDYSLYDVHVDSWRGFVFVNLADTPAVNLQAFLGKEANNLANWPLESLRVVHQDVRPVACNWKVFWENYNECYHCPRVHPELCRIMPVYKKAVFDDADLPGWQPSRPGDSGLGRVGDGNRTWTLDGQSPLPTMPGLTDDEIESGIVWASFTASMYIAAHPDYLRTVRIVPTGPESVDLVVDWLLPDSVSVERHDDIAEILGLVETVLDQDAEICELNQQGLHSRRHGEGVLVNQEYQLWRFHEWLRYRLDQVTGSKS